MTKLTVLLFLLIVECGIAYSAEKDELGNVVFGSNQRLSGVGLGWDYLEDASRYPIFEEKFSDKKTNDGEYFVPECFYVEDVKKVTYTDESNIIDKSTSYVSKFSSTFTNGGGFGFGSFIGVGGSYSADRKKIFTEQTNSKTVTISTKYIDHRYTFHANSRCPLNSLFNSAVTDIAMALENNMNNLARWYAELLVKEYGTHYLNRVKIGAILYADDFLSQYYWKTHKSDLTTIKKVTKTRFLIFFSSTSTSVTSQYTEEEKDYYNEVKRTVVESTGGKYQPGMNLTEWSKTIDRNLVVIDKEVDLISNAIIKFNFPNISETTLQTIRNMVVGVNQDYVRANTRSGCTDSRTVMYDSTANYEPSDSICAEKYKFGGTYAETIQCYEYDYTKIPPKCSSSYYKCNELHLITKQRYCPPGYKPRTGFYLSTPSKKLNLTECYGDSTKEKGGMLFGGIYSKSQNNPVTNTKGCPPYFASYDLLDCTQNQICLSLDTDNAINYAIPFFGFVSTCIPNRSCKDGEMFFVAEYDGCKLYYCSQLRNRPYPDLRKMPFSPEPKEEIARFRQLKMLKREN